MHAEHLVARSVNYPCSIIMIRPRNQLYIQIYTHIYTYIYIYIRGWLIITTITDARSFLHGMEAITKH